MVKVVERSPLNTKGRTENKVENIETGQYRCVIFLMLWRLSPLMLIWVILRDKHSTSLVQTVSTTRNTL